MKNMLSNLWHGNLKPASCFTKNNEEIKKLIQLIIRNKKELKELLNDEQKVLLDKLLCCTEEYIDLATECAFCHGFSIGMKLLAESDTLCE